MSLLGPAASVAAMRNAGQVIEFQNPRGLYGGEVISFPAFLTSFSDNVSAEFGSTKTYGRMDPIYTYQNTTRVIEFSIDIPAEDVTVAEENLKKVKRLQSLLYPTYEKSSGQNYLLSTAPLFQIKFNNLIEDAVNNSGRLLGVIPSLNFEPALDPGMFYNGRKFYPKLLKLSVTFNPLHTGPAVGWVGEQAIRSFSGTGRRGAGRIGEEAADPVEAGDGALQQSIDTVNVARQQSILAPNQTDASTGMSVNDGDY